jgi:hypothetical protein
VYYQLRARVIQSKDIIIVGLFVIILLMNIYVQVNAGNVESGTSLERYLLKTMVLGSFVFLLLSLFILFSKYSPLDRSDIEITRLDVLMALYVIALTGLTAFSAAALVFH